MNIVLLVAVPFIVGAALGVAVMAVRVRRVDEVAPGHRGQAIYDEMPYPAVDLEMPAFKWPSDTREDDELLDVPKPLSKSVFDGKGIAGNEH